MANKNERNTKIEVLLMTMVESEKNPNLKALATVILNDEFVLKGIKVVAKKDNAKDVADNGEKSDRAAFFVSMPSRVINGEYSDVFFPITKQAYEQFNNAVVDCFSTLAASGERQYSNSVDTPKESVSDISMSLYKVDGKHVKATGQMVIDDNFVVTGVKVVEANKGDVNKNVVTMPSYQTSEGDFSVYAYAATDDMRKKIQNKGLTSYSLIPEYRGVELKELGGKENITRYFDQNKSFANKLMKILDVEGIDYNAKITDTITIAIKSEDKEHVDRLKNDLSEALVNEREADREAKRNEKVTSINEEADKKPSIRESLAQKAANMNNERKSGEVKKHKEQEL